MNSNVFGETINIYFTKFNRALEDILLFHHNVFKLTFSITLLRKSNVTDEASVTIYLIHNIEYLYIIYKFVLGISMLTVVGPRG